MKRYSLGVDIGGTNIQFGIIDNNGNLIDFYNVKTEANKGRKKILENILTGIKVIMENNKKIKLEGIGVGTPGLVDENGKVITGASNLKGWDGTPVKKFLEKHFKLNIFVENDVTALALGEAKFGAGKNYHNALCLAFGTGLGGGIIIDKKIYRGKFGYAAEFGHIVVNPEGPKCSCGNRGCLETYASTVGLKRMVKERIKKNSKLLKRAGNIANITPKFLFDEYKNNNKEAKEIIKEMGYYLSMGIGILVNIFDPDVIILAGGISKAGKVLTDLIKENVYKFALPFYKNRINIKISKFKDKAGVIGTASLVFE